MNPGGLMTHNRRGWTGKFKQILAAIAGASTLAIVLVLATGAAAVEGSQPLQAAKAPIVIFTQQESERRGPAAVALLQKAREQGQVRVIVGLRMTMRMEHTLSAAEADRQAQALRTIQNAVARRVLGSTSASGLERFTFIPYMSLFVDADQLGRLLADPQVVSVHEDIPDAPSLNESIPLIHADEIWPKGFTGAGYTVAVLDTGVAKTHPMLSGKVVSEACYSTNNPTNGVTSLCPGRATSSTAPGSGVNCPASINGCDHGTHVASIAGGSAGLKGVARGANIIAIQVFSRMSNCAPSASPCARSFTTDQIRALQRVYALRSTFKIAAVNMSLAGGLFSSPCNSDPRSAAIDTLKGARIATIVAAGNNGNKTSISAPACVPSAVAVGNTTKGDANGLEHVSPSSNYGSLIDLMAPGTNIRAAVPGGYGVKTGTSMAAPHVAGAFAVLKQAKPTAKPIDIEQALACSGKTVEFPEGAGLPMPRIDLLGAYNWLRKPPTVKNRSWTFDDNADALDFTPFTGRWSVAGGFYSATMQGSNSLVQTSTANCNKSLEVTAKVRRTQPPKADAVHGVSLILKSKLDYASRAVSGYAFIYFPDGAHNPSRGSGLVFRYDNCGPTSCGGVLLCTSPAEGVTVHFNRFNLIKVVSSGSSHSFHINNELVCAATDSTYSFGPVLFSTGDTSPSAGHSFVIDTLTIRSRDTAEAADEPAVIDPAAMASRPNSLLGMDAFDMRSLTARSVGGRHASVSGE